MNKKQADRIEKMLEEQKKMRDVKVGWFAFLCTMAMTIALFAPMEPVETLRTEMRMIIAGGAFILGAGASNFLRLGD